MPAARSCLVAALAWAVSAASAPAAPIVLNAAQEKAMGITLATAKPAVNAPLATAPATVTPPLNARRVVAAPFAGTVLQIHVLEGQTVKAGAPLVTLFSRDALAVSSELAQGQAELRVAEAAARRARTLAVEGVIAGARAEEADARAARARAVVSERRRLLAGAAGTPGEYVLRAPISGRVATLMVLPGGGLEAMAPAVMVDQANKLWLEAKISPAVGRKIQVGYPVQANGAAGRVVAVGASIDPTTRSLPLRAELDDAAHLAPGQTVTVTLLAPAPAGAQAIPRSALIQDADGARVFVKSGSGYASQAVTPVGVGGNQAVVTGLPEGSRVVSSGAAQLKSALGR